MTAHDPRVRAAAFFSLLLANVRDALSGLQSNKQRSVLALLGISVGCASVITLLNIGAGASREAASAFSSMGSDLIAATLSAKTDELPSAVSAIPVNHLLRALPALDNAAGIAFYSADARLGRRQIQLPLVGTEPQFFEITRLKFRLGRSLSDFDTSATYTVLGANIAASLSSQHPMRIGDKVEMGNYYFTVIGILQPQGPNPLLSIDYDNAAFVSFKGLQRLRAISPSSLIASTRAPERSEATAKALQAYLERLLPQQTVDTQTPRQLLAGLQTQANVFSYLLSGMGIISLIAGGIGIMNVMIMSVTERRREIGVRLAIGARPFDIGLLFLTEALCLACLGSIAGTVLGLASSCAFLSLSGWQLNLAPVSFVVGIASSLLTGVFFGLHPAISAARLLPVRALRDA
ncbi:ABC transporter permease [Pseudomonas silvicola]|nr:ABC transporter permease [Pseudomonas silvicola]